MFSFGRASGMEGGDHFHVILGDEIADGQFALHQHGERGSLHAADREILAIGERVGAREIHADQPIGAAAAAGGVGERIVLGGRAEGVEAFADGVGRERRDPEAADGLGALRGFVDVAEDQLAFAAGVGGADDARDFGRVENALDGFELVLGLFVDHQRPLAGQHGKRVAPPLPPLGIDLVRLGERGQVADRPGDHVAVAVQVAIAFGAGAEHARDVARHRRLFGKHRDTSGIRTRHDHFQFNGDRGTRHPIPVAVPSGTFFLTFMPPRVSLL